MRKKNFKRVLAIISAFIVTATILQVVGVVYAMTNAKNQDGAFESTTDTSFSSLYR